MACASFRTVQGLTSVNESDPSRYDVYGVLTLWPREVRADLRSGLRAREKGDLDLSELFIQRFAIQYPCVPVSRMSFDTR